MAKALIIENGKRFNMLTVLKEEERQDWANRLKITISTLNKRLKKWDLEKALTTPKIQKNDTTNIRNGK